MQTIKSSNTKSINNADNNKDFMKILLPLRNIVVIKQVSLVNCYRLNCIY